MSTRSRSRVWGRVIAATTAVVLVGSSAALPASASGDIPIDFDAPRTKSVEYGQQWFFEATGSVTASYFGDTQYTLLDAETGKQLGTNAERMYLSGTTFHTSVYPLGFGMGFLDVGDYAFHLHIEQKDTHSATTDDPAKLTVVPAKLTTELRAVADPNNPANIVLTVLLAGRFVQEMDYSGAGYSALVPAGTWKITAKDPEGKTVFTDEVTQKTGTQSSFSSYWASPPPATTFQFDAEFTPDAASAKNFAIEPASSISMATPKANDEVVVVPGEGETPTEPVVATPVGPSLPAWALWTLIGLLVLLAATVIVLVIRLRRPIEVTA